MRAIKIASVACCFLLSMNAVAREKDNNPEIPKETYSFDLIKNLSFEPDRGPVSENVLKGSHSYPQGFYIDNRKNQLFILRYAMKKPNIPLIDIYNWDSLTYQKTLFLDNTNGRISEGLHVDSKDGKELVYIRGADSLLKFVIPQDASEGEFISGEVVIKAPIAQSFSFYGDKIFVESYDPGQANAKGEQSRGDYLIYDRKFSKTGIVKFDEKYSGTTKSEENKTPKHQGFSAYSKGFVMSMGGYWKVGAPVTPYNYQGFNFFDTEGKLISSRYMRPDIMVKLINEHGVKADRIENEGVQVLEDGSIITLNVIKASPKSSGGLLILKLTDEGTINKLERSSNQERLDLSPAALEK